MKCMHFANTMKTDTINNLKKETKDYFFNGSKLVAWKFAVHFAKHIKFIGKVFVYLKKTNNHIIV